MAKNVSNPAAESAIPDLRKAIAEGNLDVVKTALDRGAEVVNDGLSSSLTLRYALENKSSVEMVALLLDRGAKIVNDSKKGWSSDLTLYHALHKKSPEVVALLLDRGARIVNDGQITDHTLYHALQYSSVEVVALLLDRGARIVNDGPSSHHTLYHVWHRNSVEMSVYTFIARGQRASKVDHRFAHGGSFTCDSALGRLFWLFRIERKQHTQSHRLFWLFRVQRKQHTQSQRLFWLFRVQCRQHTQSHRDRAARRARARLEARAITEWGRGLSSAQEPGERKKKERNLDYEKQRQRHLLRSAMVAAT
eukprot:g74470.t1